MVDSVDSFIGDCNSSALLAASVPPPPVAPAALVASSHGEDWISKRESSLLSNRNVTCLSQHSSMRFCQGMMLIMFLGVTFLPVGDWPS